MRRVVFVFTVISLAGWSQSAPLQPQPPLQSTNSKQPPENPPNPWTQIANLAPGIITAFSALAAVWLTQRHQLRLEIAKAEIAAKHKSQDNQWEFRKAIYTNLITSLRDLIFLRIEYQQVTHHLKTTDKGDIATIQYLTERRTKISGEYLAVLREFYRHITLAPLATADSVFLALKEAQSSIPGAIYSETVNGEPASLHGTEAENTQITVQLTGLLTTLQFAGRRDLWGTPEQEAKANTDKEG